MGQIQSGVNQLVVGAIGGTVAKSVKDQQKLSEQIKKERLDKEAQAAREKEANQEKMILAVASKYGEEATRAMDPTEIEYEYNYMFHPEKLQEEEEESAAREKEVIQEEYQKRVDAGWDPRRALTFVATGIDPLEYPEESIPTSNYDGDKYQQANRISAEQSFVKQNNTKQFEQRLKSAEQCKIKNQSVGGKK